MHEIQNNEILMPNSKVSETENSPTEPEEREKKEAQEQNSGSGKESGEDSTIELDERVSLSDVDFQSPLVICLSIISRLHGQAVSAATLKAGIPQTGNVITAASIVRAAENIGIHAKTVYRKKVGAISHLVMPCILLMRSGEACVLLKVAKGVARIIMPGHGMEETEVSLKDLEKDYTGYAILCRQKSDLDERVTSINLIQQKKWFWGVILRFWPIYRHVILASIIINIIVVASPLFVMNVYDRVVPNNAIETLWALAIGIFIMYSFDFLLKNLRGYFVDVAGRNADVLIGSNIMQHLMSARLDHMPESAGSVANNVREFESLPEFNASRTFSLGPSTTILPCSIMIRRSTKSSIEKRWVIMITVFFSRYGFNFFRNRISD